MTELSQNRNFWIVEHIDRWKSTLIVKSIKYILTPCRTKCGMHPRSALGNHSTNVSTRSERPLAAQVGYVLQRNMTFTDLGLRTSLFQ